MTETSENKSQVIENLRAGFSALEVKYPRIVELLQEESRELNFNESSGQYEPARNLYYHKEFKNEDRISSLFFLAQKILISQNEKKEGFSGFVQNLRHGKEIEDNNKLATEIMGWITQNQKGWIYRGTDSLSGTGAELLMGILITKYQDAIPPKDWASFIIEAGKNVFGTIKNGATVKDIIEILDTKEYLIPLIGASKKYTSEEILTLLEEK